MSETGASIVSNVRLPSVVFICSAGHSGSTLLDLLLGSHPEAVSLGEITQLPKNWALNTSCSCGAAVRDCIVWRQVIGKLALQPGLEKIARNPYTLHLGLFQAETVVDRSHQTFLRTVYRRLVYAGAFAYWRWHAQPLATLTTPLRRGAANKWLLFQAVADTVERSILIDSSKHYLEALALYESAPRRTKVLLLARDGRAVFYSGRKRGFPRRSALNAWRRTYVRGLPLLQSRVAPEDLLQVRYEDLVTDSARELHRICEFIGIPYAAEMLDFRSHVHHVANGNDMRLRSTAKIEADTAWKRALSPADLAYFEARAGILNRSLGY
jgi:hypothetical protein